MTTKVLVVGPLVEELFCGYPYLVVLALDHLDHCPRQSHRVPCTPTSHIISTEGIVLVSDRYTRNRVN